MTRKRFAPWFGFASLALFCALAVALPRTPAAAVQAACSAAQFGANADAGGTAFVDVGTNNVADFVCITSPSFAGGQSQPLIANGVQAGGCLLVDGLGTPVVSVFAERSDVRPDCPGFTRIDVRGAPKPGPCPGAPTIPLVAGANGNIYCGPVLALSSEPFSLPLNVSAIFAWDNADQAFHFWFRGFPQSFQTLPALMAGNYYFFGATVAGGAIANSGGSAPLAAVGAASFSRVAPGVHAQTWAGGNHALQTLDSYPNIGVVSAIFAWDNASQAFRFWFRGFPDSFQTLSAGIERGRYYFFQTPGNLTVAMD